MTRRLSIAVRVIRFVAAAAAFIGGISLLGLVVNVGTLLFASDDGYISWSKPGADSFGVGLWQLLVSLIVGFIVWSFAMHVLARLQPVLDAQAERDRDEQAARPDVGGCTQCGTTFKDWDAALEHADKVHTDRTPEEARGLLVRLR